jgi:hypothetical protein
MLRSSFVVALVLAGVAFAAEAPLQHYDRVEVAPSRTFVGIASVSMTMPVFERTNGVYAADYRANVVPWVMFNEKGRLTIEFSDAMVRALERGETINIKGRAVRDDGAERRVEGRATPIDAAHGKLKVRVYYSKRINLSFDTTYRFPDAK